MKCYYQTVTNRFLSLTKGEMRKTNNSNGHVLYLPITILHNTHNDLTHDVYHVKIHNNRVITTWEENITIDNKYNKASK
jgi:hypothetical protein